MAKEIYEAVRRTWLCRGCVSPKPGTPEVDATIQELEPDNTPINIVNGCGLGIARKEFLFALGEDVIRRYLFLGRVFRQDGAELENWVTFHGKHEIIVRGSKHVSFRKCPECGKRLYFAMGKRYLYPEPPKGIEMFDSGCGGLVVTERLVVRITLNKWRKLACIKLPVFSAPKDGLAELT
ncbi:MAG: hypothetical protein HY735_21540 [Verrucomicrobia bacterium]|nr:hypothetical protein [Verrucomicrobiota bacterium]